MERYFNINYEFSPTAAINIINDILKNNRSGYICVADGVVLSNVYSDVGYRKVVNGAVFSICDSSFVPLYIKLIYGRKRSQYTGSDIFRDIVSSRKYSMMFVGTSQEILDGLQKNLAVWNPAVSKMCFYPLPYASVDNFDYKSIGNIINTENPDIIWVALGAPKQELFMERLYPYLHRGVMIAVGAVFKFYAGIGVCRAPKFIVKCHLEFLYRILQEPWKQISRCRAIVATLPSILYSEWLRKKGISMR